MSVRHIFTKDFTSASRSRALWTVATVLGVLSALIGYAAGGYRLAPRPTVLSIFETFATVLAILLPIAVLVASYMSLAGERESGGIKFLLSFPNTRRDVFLGKLASRLAVVAAGIGFMFVAATSIAVARYGTLPLGAVAGLFGLTLVYGAVFVCIAVAFSAAVSNRSRAIGGAVGTYFVTVILYVMPVVRVPSLVRWVHHTMLGFEPNRNLYNAVSYTSPFNAFRKATNLVFPDYMASTVFRRGPDATGDLPVYLSDEFSLVVFAVWLVVPLTLGYLRFEGADLE